MRHHAVGRGRQGLSRQLFRAVQISTPGRPRMVVPTGFHWNYTSILNVIALLAFAGLYKLYRSRDVHREDSPYAKDPVCGMQVEKALAPATLMVGGEQYWLCCDGCRDRFAGQAPAPPQPQFLGDIGIGQLTVRGSEHS